ncbi:MAG: zinc ABC transporter substrate-binding protein [Waddliaceae bacterium]
MLKHPLLLIPVVIILMMVCSCSSKEKEERASHYVLVSIAPYKFFVEQIAGGTVEVGQMIPTGGSPHSYEPTAKQILAASEADIWFQIGEPFETRATQALQSHRPSMKFIDMREGLDLIAETSHDDHHQRCPHHGCTDPHIWLSPRMVKQQAARIADALAKQYPEHAQQYQDRLRTFQEKLGQLDQEISKQLLPIKNQTIVVSHPSYAYFGRDYGLKQLSIEFEGKEPTPQQLTQILNNARKLNTRTVFVQPQHHGKGARLFANELDAKIVVLDPLSENYLENMRKIARSFSEK